MNYATYTWIGRKIYYILFKKNIRINWPLLHKFLHKHKYFFFLLMLYLFTRLFNLTLLPIFNDESIYLRWGCMEIQGNPYLSLYDGKQPLLMWLYGYAQLFINDPLIAGRIISVGTGFLTLIGIYELGLYFFSKRVALLSALFYIVGNIFVFYDRQALMESSLCTIGVFSCYFFLRLLKKPNIIFAILLGICLGVGLFIKLTAGIFILTIIILGFFSGMQKKAIYRLLLLVSANVGALILRPLLGQPDVSNIIAYNNRYAYSFFDFIHNPFVIIFQNTLATISILFAYLTPTVFVVTFLGIWNVLQSKNRYRRLLVLWFLTTMVIFILFTRNPSDRYIVAFLPVTVIFCGYAMDIASKRVKKSFLGNLLIVITLISPGIFTGYLLLSPVSYFTVLSFLSPYTNMGYVRSWPSGYGIPQTMLFLLSEAKNQQVTVYTGVDTGNPEDALYVYLGDRAVKNMSIFTSYEGAVCQRARQSATIAYYVTRNDEGIEPCMQLVQKFYKPVGNDYVGIYRIIL